MQRNIGEWTVSCGMSDCGRHETTEEGYKIWIPHLIATIEARHHRGGIFGCASVFASELEAEQYILALPDDFNAEQSEDFHFSRNAYGSADWGYDDELALMDDEERQRHMHHG